MNKPRSKYFFIFLALTSFNLNSQDLADEFLESLPENLSQAIANQNEDEANKIENLYNLDISDKKAGAAIKELRQKINDLEKKLNKSDPGEKGLQRFGDSYFSSIQSSFMPINIPNFNDNYVIGVGDKFKIELTGQRPASLELEVMRDGALLLTGYGQVFVSGLNFGEANNKIISFLNSKEIGSEVFITLESLRDIQVLLIGNVFAPGLYTLPGGSNAIHAINVAGGISDNGSFRDIEVIRNNEVVHRIDLYDTFTKGLNIFTSILRSGDAIKVNAAGMTVPLTGGINNEAIYELLGEESLQDLIDYAGGISPSSSSFFEDKILIKRTNPNSTQLLAVPKENADKFKLQYRDAVILPFFDQEIYETSTVKITGMVNKPGEYYISDKATLSELIKTAGGYKEGAYLFGGVLKRSNAQSLQREFNRRVYRDTVNEIIANVATGNAIDSSTLDLLLEEFQASDEISGRVITNFDIKSSSESPYQDVRIFDGDEIIIPEITNEVYLFGNYYEPSVLPYNPKYSISDYISLVGGKRESSENHFILIDPDGTSHYVRDYRFLPFDSHPDIYPGSIIYLPKDIGKVKGLEYAATVAPILSSLSIALASFNAISNN